MVASSSAAVRPVGRRLDRVDERPRQSERRARVGWKEGHQSDGLFRGWRCAPRVECFGVASGRFFVQVWVGR